MTDTLSVLLIVGAAVLGPIEAQPVDPAPNYRCQIDSVAGRYCGPLRHGDTMETLPQLCERAMREIGGEGDIRGHWWLVKTGTYTANPNDWKGPVEIRCIPTPAGYRK